MKHIVRVLALSLIFASAMVAQSNSKATVNPVFTQKHANAATWPMPTCEPGDPSCSPQ
jgi:hypothetical protein